MSTTYVAQIVAILTLILPYFGIELFDVNALAETLNTIIGVIAVVWVFIGRWNAGGINIFGIRNLGVPSVEVE